MRHALYQPSEETCFQGLEDIADIGKIARGFVFRQGFVSFPRQGFGQIGGKDFGVDVLADRFGEFTGELFQVKPVLEKLEGLLDVPAGMIQLGEGGCGIGLCINERGGEHFNLTRRQDHFDQPQGNGFVDQCHADGLGLSAGMGRYGVLDHRFGKI